MKERKGYQWVETGDGSGYWSKDNDRKTKHSHKLPLFCPYEECRRITGTIDNSYIEKYGFCALCYTMYIDGRSTPLLDVEFYVKRFKDRGY